MFPLKKMMLLMLLGGSLVGCSNDRAASENQPSSPAPHNPDVTSLNVTLPPQWRMSIESGRHAFILNVNDEFIGDISAMDYEQDFDFKHVKPNHSTVSKEESIDIPIGSCTLFTLDADNGTAASGLTGTHHVYYGIIPIAHKTIYVISYTMNDQTPETKQQFTHLLNKMNFKSSS
ncbi:hypothetical protein [Gorillibacterium sp. sgz5001074]|uniref:hypothetical protein n=1 Tax=Gorillibacterium sp. sgz5001074 TaxID=3446695 RepID=UPI003F66F5DC